MSRPGVHHLIGHEAGWPALRPIVVLWDNLNTDISGAMADLIAARDWLTVYRLPACAHEFNPVEMGWSHLKRSLANLAKRNLGQLTTLVKTRLRRNQYRPGLLDGLLAGTGLDLTPFCNPPQLRSSSSDKFNLGATHPELLPELAGDP